MAIYIEGTEGPAQGQKFHVFEGLRIGRTTGEVVLSDPKVSALHAQVESSEKGLLLLVDRNSSNGIKINGQKVRTVALMPGVRFQIGRSFFKVLDLVVEGGPTLNPDPSQDWKYQLQSLLPKASARNNSSATLVEKFDPMIELEFREGLQAESKIVLGYGPRKAGRDVLDIELHDPDAPDVAFELWPGKEGAVHFRTSYPEIVLVNESHVPPNQIKTGDLIRVGSTVIEVRFLT